MKRNLGLTAVAVACACSANAQSNVTLWGIVDVNVQHFHAGGVGSVTAVGNGSLSTSQIGFRGTEDLGGGLRAGFWLEASLNPDNGTGRATNTNNQASGGATCTVAGAAGASCSVASNGSQGIVFDRRAYASLAGNWGEMRLGHDFVPTHYNSIYFDAFNANGVARAGNFTFSGAANGPLPTAITASNSISYWTPHTLGGFYGVAMYALGENASNAANKNDGNIGSVRVGWTNGKLDVAAAYSHTSYVKTATIGNYTHANIGGSYLLGPVKLFALYNQVHVDLLAGTARKDTWELGAHYQVLPHGKLRFTYARLDDRSAATLLNANGTARSNNDANMWGVGYVHDLSKRTSLYGTWSHINNKGAATYTVSGGNAPLAGRDSSGLEMGVRHTF